MGTRVHGAVEVCHKILSMDLVQRSWIVKFVNSGMRGERVSLPKKQRYTR